MNQACRWMAAAAAAMCVTWAAAADETTGAADRASTWPRWQGRLSLGSTGSLLRVDPSAPRQDDRSPSLSLMGDYYLTRSGWGFTESGGFRATSGLVLGHGARTLLSLSAAPSRQGLSVQQHRLGGLSTPWQRYASREAETSAYVGLGYTGFSRSGWGFTADVGVLSHGASAGQLGRAAAGTQSLDDTLRALRLSPLVQMGVSYAF